MVTKIFSFSETSTTILFNKKYKSKITGLRVKLIV